jgi:hypothetical protein
MDAAQTTQKVTAKTGPRPVSPLNGVPTPTGRRKGIPNKVTQSIREAIEQATREVTDSKGRKGLTAWLLERANGGIQDRQIFAGMVAKALPLTLQGNVGGVTINLGWLHGRDVSPGTVTAQPASKSLILDADTRIDTPHTTELPENPSADPPSPGESAGGGGSE